MLSCHETRPDGRPAEWTHGAIGEEVPAIDVDTSTRVRLHAASLRSVPEKTRNKVATETKTLRVGDPSPDFTLRAHDGREITLSALRGQKVVLAFFAFAFTGT